MPASAKTTAKRSRTEETAPSSAPPTKQPATQPGFIQLFVEYYVEPEEGGRLSNTALKALIGKITGKPIKGNDGTVSAAMGARYKEYQGGTVSEKSAKEAQLERYSIRTKGGTDTEFIGVRITPSPSASAKSKAKLEQMQKLHPHAALTSGVKMSRLYAAEVKLAAPQKTKASSKADKIFPQYSGRKRDVSSLQGAANTFAPRTVGGFYEFIVESGLSTVQKVTQNGHILRLTLRRLRATQDLEAKEYEVDLHIPSKYLLDPGHAAQVKDREGIVVVRQLLVDSGGEQSIQATTDTGKFTDLLDGDEDEEEELDDEASETAPPPSPSQSNSGPTQVDVDDI